MTKNIVRNDVITKNLSHRRFSIPEKSISTPKIIEIPVDSKKSKLGFIKQNLILTVILLLLMITMPLLAVRKSENIECSSISGSAPKTFGGGKPSGLSSPATPKDSDFFCFKDKSQDKILKLSDREFMVGTLASEMPAMFEKEALKAQSVAIYTYFCRMRNDFREKNSDPDAPMFTANTDDWIYFVTDDKMREKWGDKFDEYKKKMQSSVDEVFGQVLKYNGELILAVYHAISSGMTEKAGEIFGGDEVPYLVNTPCESDKNVPSYASTVEVSAEDFVGKLKEKYPDLKISSNSKKSWIHDITHTSGGSIKKICICNIQSTGREMRTIFGLRSSNFDLNFDGDKFVFSVRGYGHGVGMSQYGAHDMAVHGSNYKEILAKFYPGAVITTL